MKILVYSPLDSRKIETSLGTADYSYYFVMQRYLPLLEEYGEVVVLDSPPDDSSVQKHLESDACIYLSFLPPNKTAQLSACPVVPVFAWEYDTIPYEPFTQLRDNWELCLRETGIAITHSHFAAEVVGDQLGESFDIFPIPAPLWDACERIRERREKRLPRGLAGVRLDCSLIDSGSYEITNTSVLPKPGASVIEERPLVPAWDGEPLHYALTRGDDELILISFNEREQWGVWAKSGHPWIILDRTISGFVELEVTLVGYGPYVGKNLQIDLGGASGSAVLSSSLRTHRIRMHVGQASNFVTFKGVEKPAQDMPDPRDIAFGISGIRIRRLEKRERLNPEVRLDLSIDEAELEGFHEREPAGRWTCIDHCKILLPASVSGAVNVRLELFHSIHNDDRKIIFRLGESRHETVLAKGQGVVEFNLDDVGETDSLVMENLGYGPSGQDGDPRELGLGVAKLVIKTRQRQMSELWPTWHPRSLLRFLPRWKRRTLLYTAVLNPSDGRKNWEDIVTAFVYAFRDRADVTLLIKITNHDLPRFFEDIFTFFKELHPFSCRLVFAHGYLSDAQYDSLVANTHYVVNASRGEGQCLPLMEFMSSGVPAIAPQNTAMGEYIDESDGFPVASSPELTHWPHDPREVFRTHWHRIDWDSLYQAFKESERLLRESPQDYRKMALAAVNAQEEFCSARVFRREFPRFIERGAEMRKE